MGTIHSGDNMVNQRVILIVLIMILIGVNLVLFANGINLDCGKCEIKFRNNRVSGVAIHDLPVIEVSAQELFDKFNEGQCKIKWDRVRGYYE